MLQFNPNFAILGYTDAFKGEIIGVALQGRAATNSNVNSISITTGTDFQRVTSLSVSYAQTGYSYRSSDFPASPLCRWNPDEVGTY